MATVRLDGRELTEPARFYTDGALELEWYGDLVFERLGAVAADIDRITLELTEAEKAESQELEIAYYGDHEADRFLLTPQPAEQSI